ncbi:CCR4-NOT transcription complex subunit 10-B [Trichoplax sp. H2]|nr:CCR4-NOT transcription complex subunit 10-B [Trichoplax sp. H2]|eukprot:RDD40276.1 CCR4-NOT transcription complex subunit 10-B [Trichoplax sp. H2]
MSESIKANSEDHKEGKNDRSSNGILASDDERVLAQKALLQFHSRKYEECLRTINELLEIRQNDPKVCHNLGVAQFYKSSCTKLDELTKVFDSVLIQFSGENGEDQDSVDEFDQAALNYNKALILYFFRQYEKASDIIEGLFKIIEPLDENLACKICFLAADLSFATRQANMAGEKLAYIEKMITSSEKGSTNQHHEKSETFFTVGGGTKHGLQSESLQMKFNQYKARLHLLNGPLKLCKREIKILMSSTPVTPTAHFLKSNFEYLRKNYRKSIKILNSSPRLDSNELIVMYYNNLGCIHHQMKKHNLAALYCKKAMNVNEECIQKPNDSGNINSLSAVQALNRHYELLYNIGIELLFSNRPLPGFEALIQCMQAFNTDPKYWFRIAECCISAYRMGEEEIAAKAQNKSYIVSTVVGVGQHQKTVLKPTADYSYRYLPPSHGISVANPEPSLKFALPCLKNALLLLSSVNYNNNDQAIQRNDNSRSRAKVYFSPSAAGMNAHDIIALRYAILAAIAFVSLQLGELVLALERSKELLALPSLPGLYRYLGHMYAAEALIRLNKIDEAVQHLSPETITDISCSFSTQPETTSENKTEADNISSAATRHKFPRTIESARALMFVNLASAYCLQRKPEKARKCIEQASVLRLEKEHIPGAVLISIYIELANGNVASALEVLKRQQLYPFQRNNGSKNIRNS